MSEEKQLKTVHPRARLYVADLIRAHLKRLDDIDERIWGEVTRDSVEPTEEDIALVEDFPDALRADIERLRLLLEAANG